MRYFAVTFTDEKFIRTRQRYVAEMASKDIFEEIFSYGPEDLGENFIQQHGDFIVNNKRGYGYWIWKPYLILKALDNLQNGDVLVYGDAGCELKGTREECLQKFNIVKTINTGTKVIANHSFRNYTYIKTDLYFRIKWNAILFAPRIMAASGRIVIEKNQKTIKFMQEWLKLCTSDYRNIDDSPSNLPNLPRFIEHRHDQSVFSLLFCLFKCKMVDFENVWTASRLKF